jgi:hypothetical protein
VTECPSTTTLENGKCVGCDPNCALCNTEDSKKCDKCSSGYYLLDNTCYTGCPDGYSPSIDKTTCIKTVIEEPVNDTSSTDEETEDNSAPISLYFPVTSTQTVLGGIVGGSYLANPASLVSSNCIALWGPLEFISFGG